MNQSILFNDDLSFDADNQAWRMTGLVSGQLVSVYFYSMQLKQLTEISLCLKYDLEETVELWLEDNEPENNEIHVHLR